MCGEHKYTVTLFSKGCCYSNSGFISVLYIGAPEQLIKYYKDVFACAQLFGYLFDPQYLCIKVAGPYPQVIRQIDRGVNTIQYRKLHFCCRYWETHVR